MKKTCPECGDSFHGRADKRFCCVECRNSFNNTRNRDANNFMRNINNILRKNRRIIARLNPNGKAHIHRDKLLELGFKFSYFTNEYVTKSGRVYRFCYDQGYFEGDNGYLTLVIRQEYVE